MAEIKIEKKGYAWAWLLVPLLLAAGGYYFLYEDNEPEDAKDSQSSLIPSAIQITAYATYVEDPQMGLNHQYSSGAITKLVDATNATAKALNVDTGVDLSKAKLQADEITKDPNNLNHADKIKTAALSIAMALKAIQDQKYPSLKSQYDAVENAVAGIEPATPTLQQKDAINLFFSNAAQLLTDMKDNYGK